MSSVVQYTSVREAREHFKEVLDAAGSGRPATLTRAGQRVAVVDAERLVAVLGEALPSRAEVVAEAGGWSIFLPGVPVSADAETFELAVEEMVDALRDYAEAWSERLRLAPNHQQNWALVQFIALADDDHLAAWIAA